MIFLYYKNSIFSLFLLLGIKHFLILTFWSYWFVKEDLKELFLMNLLSTVLKLFSYGWQIRFPPLILVLFLSGPQIKTKSNPTSGDMGWERWPVYQFGNKTKFYNKLKEPGPLSPSCVSISEFLSTFYQLLYSIRQILILGM